jgi:hypothetical protein
MAGRPPIRQARGRPVNRAADPLIIFDMLKKPLPNLIHLHLIEA